MCCCNWISWGFICNFSLCFFSPITNNIHVACLPQPTIFSFNFNEYEFRNTSEQAYSLMYSWFLHTACVYVNKPNLNNGPFEHLQTRQQEQSALIYNLTKVFNCWHSWSSARNTLCLADRSHGFQGEKIPELCWVLCERWTWQVSPEFSLIFFPKSHPGRKGPAAAVAPLRPAFSCCSLPGFARGVVSPRQGHAGFSEPCWGIVPSLAPSSHALLPWDHYQL